MALCLMAGLQILSSKLLMTTYNAYPSLCYEACNPSQVQLSNERLPNSRREIFI